MHIPLSTRLSFSTNFTLQRLQLHTHIINHYFFAHNNITLLAYALELHIMPAQHTFHYHFTFYTKFLLDVANVADQ